MRVPPAEIAPPNIPIISSYAFCSFYSNVNIPPENRAVSTRNLVPENIEGALEFYEKNSATDVFISLRISRSVVNFGNGIDQIFEERKR